MIVYKDKFKRYIHALEDGNQPSVEFRDSFPATVYGHNYGKVHIIPLLIASFIR